MTGLFQPTLRMSRTSKLAFALRSSRLMPEEDLPPIFGRCGQVLPLEDEEAARQLYWEATSAPALDAASPNTRSEISARLCALEEASVLNPFVAEPHIARAQMLLQLGEWGRAEEAAAQGLELLCDWATQWDKRMPWNAWVNWARCLAFQASLHEWPTTHGGIESLGAVQPSQRFRSLNVHRSQEK